MFSQFRNVVEHLAQETTRALENASLPENQTEAHSRSQPLETAAQRSASAPSSGQLADSALSTLRKSLASQRAGTSSSTTRSGSPAPTEKRLPKSNLEERLRRATTGIVEPLGPSTSNRSPPNRSSTASPSSMSKNPVNRHQKSPSSTPLPGSPAVTAVIEDDSKLALPTELSLQELPMTSEVPPPKEPENQETNRIPDPSPLVEDTISAPAEDTLPKDKDSVEVIDVGNSNSIPLVEDSPMASEPEPPKDKDDDVVERTSSVDISPHPIEVQRIDQVEESPCVIAAVSPENDHILRLEEAVSIPLGPKSSDETEMGEAPVSSPKTVSTVDHSAEVERLQERLRQVEQRFTDVSTSFKRLQAERLAADAVLRETSSLESIQNTTALRDFFTNLKTKDQVFEGELKRLNEKLETQEGRFAELQNSQRVELSSRSEEVQKLRTQMAETEALFEAAQRATSHAEDTVNTHQEQIYQLQKDIEDVKSLAKEEEEKRVKAISLLKTVRQKLVKAEKDREDALKEANFLKDREKNDKDKEHAERLNFQYEKESLTAAHDKATATLRSQFEKDIAATRERYEEEIAALRGQSELDLASITSASSKELSVKSAQITALESSLNNATRDKNAFFDQLQLRQAEVESAQAHLESLEHQNTELQFQLRESNDRIGLLREECAELVREQESRVRDPVHSADDIARMVSATEVKYEAKLSEFKRNLAIMEKERYESEADWSRKLKEKVKDLEELKHVLGSATKTRENDENLVTELKAQLSEAQGAVRTLQRQNSELPLLRDQITELEKSIKEGAEETSVKILVLEKQIEETKNRESQTRQANKTLREELRKVQSSAALLERQRNPGVGYWTTRKSESSAPSDPRMSISTPTDSPSRVSSPTPSTDAKQNEEEVNLEYLRNVILQFLEHKEMRPNLVKVLSIILHFTPQETRRLIAKV